MTRRRVLLAEDHPIVAEGLRRILESDFEIVGVVADGRALVTAAETLRPDLIIVDVSMPLMNGIEACRRIKRATPNARIIFLTMHRDAAYAREALEAGGSGYVLKTSFAAELMTAIQEVLKGRLYVSPAIPQRVLEGLWHQKAAAKLTERQREVLQLVAEGRSQKEIADILHISTKTVEYHKYRIAAELGLRSTAEWTQYAIKHRIVST